MNKLSILFEEMFKKRLLVLILFNIENYIYV